MIYLNLLTFFLISAAFSNGIGRKIDVYPMSPEEKAVQKEKKIKRHNRLLKKEDHIKQEMEENPRNKAIIKSFEDISSQGN